MASRAYYSLDSNKFDHTIAIAILQYKDNYTAPSYPSFPTIFPGFHDNDAANNFTLQFRSLASSDYPINVPINVNQKMYVTVSVSRFHPPQDILLAYYWNLSGIYDTNFPNEPPIFFNFTGDGTVLSADDMQYQGTRQSFYVVGTGYENFNNETDPDS
ncbi:hypothetical protein CsSME_00001399 [Camellia sinensis var. sinensis]